MPQWEYRKIDLSSVPFRTDDIDVLGDAGQDRWELVGITTNNTAYLKRQIEEPAPAKSSRRKSATPPAQET